ncbi:FAD-binding oxidoreductase [Streptomyces sp. C10-9-1]|uniref:globin domain-containing protein n=1 Tax=Streptomyces sp. C10-9-1 TaxID=1859285 RepID=UPI0021121C08|nr:globin domain-containing protein [Streptomyces sp. C10-9-1]MCQ6555898.1 FAD-binding oxidoreductase [Streptomyces sp. C10-9-1]
MDAPAGMPAGNGRPGGRGIRATAQPWSAHGGHPSGGPLPGPLPPLSPGTARPNAEQPVVPADPDSPVRPAGPWAAGPGRRPQLSIVREAADPGEAPEARRAPTAPPVPETAPTAPPSRDAVLVRRTMAAVAPVADQLISYFYALLFVRHPALRPMFPVAMDLQRDRLVKALLTAAEHMDDPAVLSGYLGDLGRGHRRYGTQSFHYPAVGEALIGALTRYAAEVWDAETEAAWVRTYTTISQIMIDAAAEDERRHPAWWDAEVVSHDLRTPEVAVVTLRPDRPYPFLAGQYTALETPWWPRVWRHYSFAGAPRADGLLTFHVKAVPAGWVSGALVHRARPGDVLRIGPPAGSMTVDHASDRGLLCLGGGTGIAPITALVEDVAGRGGRRPVEVFYGARSDHDLYALDTLRRLGRTYPWLSVLPVVDADARLPAALRRLGRYGPWDGFDACLSGPAGMIRNGVEELRTLGFPGRRILHDAVEDLVPYAY